MTDDTAETARMYDPESGRVLTIPVRELTDAMIAVPIEGIDGLVYVDQALIRLEKGPIRHDALPPPLVERIERLADVFDEVLPGHIGEWVDDFRRDVHPEHEVALWERLAGEYLRFTDPHDPRRRKRDVLKVLLNCANNSPGVASVTAECDTLSRDEVQTICERWKNEG